MKAQDLKNSILQMAVQGKLAPQDPADEPASVLLERIREERAELVRQKKAKAPKGGESVIYRDGGSWYECRGESEPACIDEEIPFDIPDSWEWARLENVTIYIQRGKSPKYSPIKKYPVVAQKCNQWSGFSIEKAQFIDPDTVERYTDERILREGDLMWNSTGLGTLGRMAIYRSSANSYGWAVADSHVTVIRTQEHWLNYQFAFDYFTGPSVQLVIEDQASGSTKQKELAQETVKNYLIPIPPLAEQRRIVDRVDELMPLVEEYGELEDTREALDAALPDRLRKSILQMAVQGKLAPQDPADEPASALLERIREERAELIKQKKIKAPKGGESVIYREGGSWYERRGKSDPACIDDEIPFEIPESWTWCRLREVVDIQLGKMLDKAKNTGMPVSYLGNANVQWGYFNLNEVKTMKLSEADLIRFKLKKGDLIVCEGGVPGRCAIWNREEDMWYQKALHRLRPLLEEISIEYCSIFIEWAVKTNVFPSSFTGSTIKHLPARNLESWLIPLPPDSEQRRIVATVGKSVACFEEN